MVFWCQNVRYNPARCDMAVLWTYEIEKPVYLDGYLGNAAINQTTDHRDGEPEGVTGKI